MATLKDAAVRYAEMGYKVFPVKPMDKAPPLVQNWPALATSDVKQVERWWNDWPTANIAIHCVGMLVIDIDGAEWSEDNWATFSEMAQVTNWMVDTPRNGGMHYWYRLPLGEKVPNSVSQAAKGVDVRSDGGYVLVPPSRRDCGQYNWQHGQFLDVPYERLQVVPQSILNWIKSKTSDKTHDSYRKTRTDPTIPITDGTRNMILYRIGCYLRRGGAGEPSLASYLRAENVNRCQPPLPDREVLDMARRICASIPANQDAQATIEGWEQSITDTWSKSDTPRTLPASAFANCHPLMRQYVEWCTTTNRRPQRELALGSAVAAMLALGSRKVFSLFQGSKTYAHGYVLLLAESGEGKERPRECLLDLLRASGTESANSIGPENFTSPAAIFNAVASCGNRANCAIDEIGRILGHWRGGENDNNGAAGNLSALLTLYNNSKTPHWVPRGYADAKKNLELYYPHLTILGSSVPTSVWDALGVESVGDGVLGRMLIFEAPQEYVSLQELPDNTDPPADLVELGRAWNDYEPGGTFNGRADSKINPNMQPWRFDPEAELLFKTWIAKIESIRRESPKGHRPIWSRSPERAAKLILANSIASGPRYGRIDYQSVAWGTALEEFLSRRILYQCTRWVAESKWEAWVNRLVRASQDASEGFLTGRQVHYILRNLRPKERKDVLEDAIESGRILRVEVPNAGPGRPPFHYKPA